MAELVNYGVPVALLATPQFEQDKQSLKERAGWNWDQFDRRIGIPVTLPNEISDSDLAAVAKAKLPSGDAKTIRALVAYALWSNSQLAGIDHIVTRAQFQAGKEGRAVEFRDIEEAIRRRKPVDQPSPQLPRKKGFRHLSPQRETDFGSMERSILPSRIEKGKLLPARP